MTQMTIICVERQGDGQEKKLLGQVKHSISISERDPAFSEVIQAAWNDFNNHKMFTKGKDSIALITGPLSAPNTSDVRDLLEWSRSCENPEEFFRKVELAKYSCRENGKS